MGTQMSGEKSYTVNYEAQRRIALQAILTEMLDRRAKAKQRIFKKGQARRRAEADKQRTATRERVRAEREGLQRRRDLQERSAAEQAKRNQKAESNRQQEHNAAMIAAHSACDRLADIVECAEDEHTLKSFSAELEAIESDPLANVTRAKELASRLISASESIQLAADLRNAMAELESWKQCINEDEAISHFKRGEAAEWQERVSRFHERRADGLVEPETVLECQTFLRQAEELFAKAGETKAKFDSRNVLLRDVIDSMKDIGFYVSDPQFEQPDDPSAPVILLARRGKEEMVASVDLSNAIQSTWNGITETGCRESFFEFVDKMRVRQAVVVPTRTDLLPPSDDERGKEFGVNRREQQGY